MFVILSLLLSFSLSANEVPQNYSPERFIIKTDKVEQLKSLAGVEKVQNLFSNVYVAYTKSLETTLGQAQKLEGVHYLEKDYQGAQKEPVQFEVDNTLPFAARSAGPFNDPMISRQWTLKDANQQGISVLRAYSNNPKAKREKIIVAVVDTGVDATHKDLPMWTNPNEIAGNGIDDDNNGYIDDIHGINTLIRDKQGKATMDTRDTHGHGTHVSGSIGAIQNNGVGIAGVATNVEIMAIRTVPNRNDEKDVDVIEAFIYAAKNGAKIINCSFGKNVNEGGMAVAEAIDYIGKEYGVLVVAAAGNDSRNIDRRPTYPASFASENLLVVGSTAKSGRLSFFSNFGPESVDVAAPGSGIYSTIPNNSYASYSGTSMASPNTAGLAAEVWSQNPQLQVDEVKRIIMDSVTEVKSFNLKIGTGGRVDLDRALDLTN